MKHWLTTDTHFAHGKMIEFCGRPNNFEDIIEKGLLQIPHGDTLIHLGDICIGQDQDRHNRYIKPLQCKKILVLGNHDKKSATWYMNNGWDFVTDGIRLRLFGKRILLTHIPQPWDGWYDINIHGHFHNADYRKQDPGLSKILTDKHKLLALEYTDYKPVLIENFIK